MIALESIEEAEAWTRAVRPGNILPFLAVLPEPQPAAEIPDAFPDCRDLPESEEIAIKAAWARRQNLGGLTPAQRSEVETIARGTHADAIKAIREALKARSGKAWSVTGGTGTAYGWLRIDAPPARRTAKHQRKAGAVNHQPEDYEEVDTGEAGGHMTAADRLELAALLGLEYVHHQGHSVPSQTDFYRVAICQALHGHAGPFTAKADWD